MADNELGSGLFTIAWWAYTRPRAAARYLGQISPSDLSLVAAAEDTPTPLIWLSSYPRVPQYGWGVAQAASSFILEGRDTLARRLLWAPYRLRPDLGWVAISDITSTATFGGEAPYQLYLKPIQWRPWSPQPRYGWPTTHDESTSPSLQVEGRWQPPPRQWPRWRPQPQRGWSAPTNVVPTPVVPVVPVPIAVTTRSGTGTFVASGTVAVPSGATSIEIVGPFPSAPGTSYQVFISTNWLTDWDIFGPKRATNFTVVFSVPAPVTGATIDWMVWR